MSRSLTRTHLPSDPPPSPIANFYREEFLKHLAFLQLQRGYYSDGAFAQAEQALDRILEQLDALCARQNAGEVLGRLLASFDCVTGVSWLGDGKHVH
jgi:hypothetical protein